MKPQRTPRDSLCSPKEYLLLEITEEVYPVYSMVGSGTEQA
jgi:hypothetical protein